MATGAKRDFGSFHSSNVQDLLEASDYEPPAIPINLPRFQNATNVPFGKTMKDEHFLLGDDYTFLNHGAFGCVLKEALDAAQAWQRYIESQPLKFLDRELFPQLVYVTRRLAAFIGCDAINLALIQNATTGINAVLKSKKFNANDTIYYLDCTYGAVKKLLKFLNSESGVQLKEIKLPTFIESQEQIIELVKSTLSQECTFAIFDHIPSNFPVIMPVKELTAICRERNIPILIDGAHALGSLSLNLKDIDADFYVSNAHKWLCCPKGCAFLYVKRCWQSKIRSHIVSHGFGSGFNSEFMWTGLRDFSPLLSLYTVLDFWLSQDPNLIRKYIYDLITRAEQLLVEKWSTKLAASKNLFGSMSLVHLPISIVQKLAQDCNLTYKQAELVQNLLYSNYQIEVPIKVIGDSLCVRISAHIHNDISDYERLADAVCDLATKLG